MSENGTDELNEKLRYAQNLITILQTMLNERTAQAIQLEARIKCLTEDLEKSKFILHLSLISKVLLSPDGISFHCSHISSEDFM